MSFHCLVHTARYLGLTRGLLRWRWTMITMAALYFVNLLHPLLQEEMLTSIERSGFKNSRGEKSLLHKSFRLASSRALEKLTEAWAQGIMGCGKHQISVLAFPSHEHQLWLYAFVCYSRCLPSNISFCTHCRPMLLIPGMEGDHQLTLFYQ